MELPRIERANGTKETQPTIFREKHVFWQYPLICEWNTCWIPIAPKFGKSEFLERLWYSRKVLVLLDQI